MKYQVKDLKVGMKQVDVEGKILDKSPPREVVARSGNATYQVADAKFSDETGEIKLTLWNEQIGQVNVNDTVKIENGYITSWRGEIQLNIGRYGKLSKIT